MKYNFIKKAQLFDLFSKFIFPILKRKMCVNFKCINYRKF